jgi:hypothetical protein
VWGMAAGLSKCPPSSFSLETALGPAKIYSAAMGLCKFLPSETTSTGTWGAVLTKQDIVTILESPRDAAFTGMLATCMLVRLAGSILLAEQGSVSPEMSLPC